jgi:hypothetical protein
MMCEVAKFFVDVLPHVRAVDKPDGERAASF